MTDSTITYITILPVEVHGAIKWYHSNRSAILLLLHIKLDNKFNFTSTLIPKCLFTP